MFNDCLGLHSDVFSPPRAVSDAEKLVGYPTSYLALRTLLDDEFANIAVHLR